MASKSETKDNSTLYTESVCLTTVPCISMYIYKEKTFKTPHNDNYPNFLTKMREILLLL